MKYYKICVQWNTHAHTKTHQTQHINVSVRKNTIEIVFRVIEMSCYLWMNGWRMNEWMGDWVCASKNFSFYNGHVLHQAAATSPYNFCSMNSIILCGITYLSRFVLENKMRGARKKQQCAVAAARTLANCTIYFNILCGNWKRLK